MPASKVRFIVAGFASALFLPWQANAELQLTAEEKLGKQLFSDQDLSLNRNQSCATCHSLKKVNSGKLGINLPSPGFVDPQNVLTGSPVSAGSVAGQHGVLNAPSVGYAAFSPFFHWDGNEGLYIGGQFWNGRAATLADQAKQPFMNPREMAMPNAWAVVGRLQEKPRYVQAFRKIYGLDLAQIPTYSVRDSEAIFSHGKRRNRHGNEFRPFELTPPGVNEIYNKIAQAIAAFEKSRFFNRFTSKFDFYLIGQTTLNEQETKGLQLFEGKALCSACHVSETTIAPDGSEFPPLFTDFTYDNIGVPRNDNIFGNPEPDLGLGGREDIAERDPEGNEIGKHKVMSLRNIAITPPYAHNGFFPTLESIVHFYNTRDVANAGWQEPEIPRNVNDEELGNLGLSAEEEAALVAFLQTLTDGYPEWGNDPNVPVGTPSPYAATPFPSFP
ncbi:cytochrome-c peroxidase [Methylomarinum vadi]|uniref:cytochrome-c peroxidase n=1 Tax=Methylomarinum vadi TaxID=438855 RepID=UPI00068B7987|nr:cytochrome c peroxidase [Methylomarinum vadi]